MKKTALILIASILLTSLTGCTATEPSDSGTSDNSSTASSENYSEISTESTGSNEATGSENSIPLSDDVVKLLELCPAVADYIGYDGNKMPLDRITEVGEFAEEWGYGKLKYNLGYLTYGIPCFATTVGNADWKSEGGFSDIKEWIDFYEEKGEKINDPKYFMVEPGDRLENGLVVKSAETTMDYWPKGLPEGMVTIPKWKIEFDGTLTLEGVLYRHKGNPTYSSINNDVFFYPDTTKYEFVPMYSIQDYVYVNWFDSENAIVNCGSYYLGNPDEGTFEYDIDEYLRDKQLARARVTLKNISIGGYTNTSRSLQNAEADKIEIIE